MSLYCHTSVWRHSGKECHCINSYGNLGSIMLFLGSSVFTSYRYFIFWEILLFISSVLDISRLFFDVQRCNSTLFGGGMGRNNLSVFWCDQLKEPWNTTSLLKEWLDKKIKITYRSWCYQWFGSFSKQLIHICFVWFPKIKKNEVIRLKGWLGRLFVFYFLNKKKKKLGY